MYAVRRTGENREGTQRSTWGSNAPRIIGWASAALCAVAVLSLAASTSRPMQLAETFSQLGNATNATDQATAPAGAKKEVCRLPQFVTVEQFLKQTVRRLQRYSTHRTGV